MNPPSSSTSAASAGSVATMKATAQRAFDERRDTLVALADDIHGHPELAFEEDRAAQRVAGALRANGFAVDEGICDLPTAFSARIGAGALHVVICAEYDALPGVGHACGHNLIAAAAVGAGIALAPLVDELGLTLTVLGTPAEEGGGGKVLLLDRGAFTGAHAAMMVHPWPEDRLRATCLAVDHLQVTYTGRQAHASAAPERGINAGDAMVIAQVAIGLLRQHLPAGDQVHGVVDCGGQAPNVVPHTATGRWMLRSSTVGDLEALRPRVRRCFEAGALGSGATLATTPLSPTYTHFEPDVSLLAAWRANAEALGRRYRSDDDGEAPPTLSTDMANVSLAIPAIHPLIGVDAGGASNHQPEFAAACTGPSAQQALADGAVAMAFTAIDAAADPSLRHHLLEPRR